MVTVIGFVVGARGWVMREQMTPADVLEAHMASLGGRPWVRKRDWGVNGGREHA